VADTSGIKQHMEVIGADGVHVGTVDAVEGDRLKLTKSDSSQGGHQGHHHFISAGLIAEVEGEKVRLTTTGANALMFQEEENLEEALVTAGAAPVSVPKTFGSKPAAPAPVATDAKAKWNWNKIGLGAAAIGTAGAAAGAALLARKGSDENDDFELRLQTDENVRLISSTKVVGTPVVGLNGEALGTVESFMVDKYSGRVAYAVMAFDGTMGFQKSLFPLPWPMLEYDVDKDGYKLDITKEQLASAPKFEASDEPEFDAGYRENILLFYRNA